MISEINEDVKLITKSLNWPLVMGQPSVSHILPWLLNLVYRNDNKLKIQFVSFLTHKIVICLQAVGWKKYPDISCFRLKLLCGLCYLWLWFSTNIRHPPIHSSNCCLSVSNKQILMRCSYCVNQRRGWSAVYNSFSPRELILGLNWSWCRHVGETWK